MGQKEDELAQIDEEIGETQGKIKEFERKIAILRDSLPKLWHKKAGISNKYTPRKLYSGGYSFACKTCGKRTISHSRLSEYCIACKQNMRTQRYKLMGWKENGNESKDSL